MLFRNEVFNSLRSGKGQPARTRLIFIFDCPPSLAVSSIDHSVTITGNLPQRGKLKNPGSSSDVETRKALIMLFRSFMNSSPLKQPDTVIP